jgi:hypothetical protein
MEGDRDSDHAAEYLGFNRWEAKAVHTRSVFGKKPVYTKSVLRSRDEFEVIALGRSSRSRQEAGDRVKMVARTLHDRLALRPRSFTLLFLR